MNCDAGVFGSLLFPPLFKRSPLIGPPFVLARDGGNCSVDGPWHGGCGGVCRMRSDAVNGCQSADHRRPLAADWGGRWSADGSAGG